MSEVQHFAFEADGEIYEVETDTVIHEIELDPTTTEEDVFDEERGLQKNAIARMQQARQMIRAYTAYPSSVTLRNTKQQESQTIHQEKKVEIDSWHELNRENRAINYD